MMKRVKKRSALGILGILLALTLVGAGKAEASECYALYYDWNCTPVATRDEVPLWDVIFVGKHKDGSVTVQPDGWFYGIWYSWGSSFFITVSADYYDQLGQLNCEPLYAGTKGYGYIVCRDGSRTGKSPGCWFWVKTKLNNCPWIHEGRSSIGGIEGDEEEE